MKKIKFESLNRRSFTKQLAATAMLPLFAKQTLAAKDTFPEKNRNIRIIVGLAAGGASDGHARFVAKKLSDLFESPVIVENRPGASFMVATEELIRSPADGYTIMYVSSSVVAQNPHTLRQIKYDPFKDLTPISLGARGPLILSIHNSVPANSVQELISYIKSNPGKISYASFGAGTSSHIYGEIFCQQAGLDAVHVPYKGGADAAKDFLAGRVHFYFDASPNAIQNSATGKVRMLAVADKVRSPVLPDLPTMSEAGIQGVDMPSWLGFYGPPNMPNHLVDKINKGLFEVLSTDEAKKFFRQGANEPSPTTPDELAKITKETYDLWGNAIKKIGWQKI